MDLILLTSLNSYISTLRLARFALLWIPACSESNNTNTRLTAFTLSLTLDPMFGIHSHKTSGNAQLLHLLRRTWKLSFFHSTSVPVNFSSHFSYQKLYLCVFVCVCVCVWVWMLVCVCACVYINASVCVLVCAIHLLIRWVTVCVYLLFVNLLCVCV